MITWKIKKNTKKKTRDNNVEAVNPNALYGTCGESTTDKLYYYNH